MLVNIREFLDESNVADTLYPGKVLVKPCHHAGEFKSHCVVIDWRNPSEIVVEVKAGITGKQLPHDVIKKYPVCFQMPTYVKIDVTNDNNEDDDESSERGKRGKGSSGGGGKKMQKKKKLDDVDMIADRFDSSASGHIPIVGKIKEMMVLGVKIAKDALESTFGELKKQIAHAKVSATEILAKTGEFVKRVQPPAYVKPKGDETVKYQYDRLKNADIGMKSPGM